MFKSIFEAKNEAEVFGIMRDNVIESQKMVIAFQKEMFVRFLKMINILR